MKRFTMAQALLVLVLVAGCGGGDDSDDGGGSPTTSRTARPSASPTRAAVPAETAEPALTEATTEAPTEAPQQTQPPAIETAPPAPAANNPPGFPSAVQTSEETNYEYDDDGNLTGAVTTLSVAPATDPDGDPLTYSWAATTGSISGNGLSATWVRAIEFGAPAPGTVVITASDGRGGTTTFTIEFI